MATQYLSSNNVKLFPSSTRTGYDVYSRFTTELNLVDIVTRVSSGKFVTKTFTDSGNLWIDFTLLGYRFNINVSEKFSTYTGPLYAIAIVGHFNEETRYDDILKGYDGGIQNNVDDGPNTANKFIGLQIATSQTDCTSFQSTIAGISTGTFNCDYILLGTKTGTTAFTINPELSTLSVDTLTTEDIDTAWNNAQ